MELKSPLHTCPVRQLSIFECSYTIRDLLGETRAASNEANLEQFMLEKLANATRTICGAKDKNGLLHTVQAHISSFGFGSFNLGCHKTDKYDLALNPTLTTWSDGFMSEYKQRNWAEFDPNLARAATVDKPFIWRLEDRYRSRNQQSYIDFLYSTPLKGGVCIPLSRRFGTISCVSVESHVDRRYDNQIVYAISVIANSAALKAELLGLCKEMSVDESIQLRKLSERQIEILKWASEGKSNGEIAIIMYLSERVVKYHISEILRKLGVATRGQAISMLAAGLDKL